MTRRLIAVGLLAWQTFVELPTEAPSLAWRYLTDGSSFYRQPRQ